MPLSPHDPGLLPIQRARRVEVVGFFIKVVMTFASVFVLNAKWLSVIQIICALLLLSLYLQWVSGPSGS